MPILLNTDDYFDHLIGMLDVIKPKTITIASYGFFVGIMPDGRDLITWQKFKSRARNFLELIINSNSNIEINILVGLYSYKSCRKDKLCVDCEKQYLSDLIRHVTHAEKFPQCNWRVSDSSHIKCVIMENSDNLHVVTGSRNFSDSDWTDVSLDVNAAADAVKIRDFIYDEWNNAKILNNDSVAYYLSKNNISQQTIDLLF